jgi:hypothetical protein
MEWVILLVLAFLGYMWARNHEAQKKERLELRLFSHRRWFTDYMGQDWDLDFVDMSLTVARFDNEAYPPIKEAPAKYAVRRQTSGRWQCKMTEQSRETAIKEVEAELEADPKPLASSLTEMRQNQLKDLQGLSKWVAIDDEVVGPLESQYQRFVVHYKAS